MLILPYDRTIQFINVHPSEMVDHAGRTLVRQVFVTASELFRNKEMIVNNTPKIKQVYAPFCPVEDPGVIKCCFGGDLIHYVTGSM